MNISSQRFFVGDYQIDRQACQLRGPNGDCDLEEDQVVVMEALAEHAGEPVRREEIIDAVWHGEKNAGRLLTSNVDSLRQLFGDDSATPQYIETVPGYGYRLVAPVRKSGANGHTSLSESEPHAGGFWHFLLELRQRKVCRAALMYAVAVWLICQIAELIFDAMDFPEWTLPLIIVVGILGFPIALILAWTFEVTPNGLALDIPVANSATAGRNPKDLGWNCALLAASVLISLQMLLYGFGEIEPPGGKYDQLRNARSIVVTPFQATSVSLEARAYAFVLSEEVRHLLHAEYKLDVIHADSTVLTREQKRADLLLQGSVAIASGEVTVIVHLVDPSDGYDLWSDMIVIGDNVSPVSQHRAARAMLRALPIGIGSGGDAAETLASTGNLRDPDASPADQIGE